MLSYILTSIKLKIYKKKNIPLSLVLSGLHHKRERRPLGILCPFLSSDVDSD